MSSLLERTALSVVLPSGMWTAAQAQSVSALPPQGELPGQTARSPVYSSTQSFLPKPGGAEVLKEQPYQPPSDYAANPADHPYSTSIGPAPGSHSSGADRLYAPPQAWDADANRHPYSSGIGPKPN